MRFASGDDGAFEQAEVAVDAECGYGDFEVCIAEMREAQIKAKEAMSKAGMAPGKTSASPAGSSRSRRQRPCSA